MQFEYPADSAALRIMELDFGVPEGRKYFCGEPTLAVNPQKLAKTLPLLLPVKLTPQFTDETPEIKGAYTANETLLI